VDQIHQTLFTQRGRNGGTKPFSPILSIFIPFGDIRRRTSKSSEIGPNFACFSPLNFFSGGPFEILDRHYKTRRRVDERAKFHGDRPTHLGDLTIEIKYKTSALKNKAQRR